MIGGTTSSILIASSILTIKRATNRLGYLASYPRILRDNNEGPLSHAEPTVITVGNTRLSSARLALLSFAGCRSLSQIAGIG